MLLTLSSLMICMFFRGLIDATRLFDEQSQQHSQEILSISVTFKDIPQRNFILESDKNTTGTGIWQTHDDSDIESIGQDHDYTGEQSNLLDFDSLPRNHGTFMEDVNDLESQRSRSQVSVSSFQLWNRVKIWLYNLTVKATIGALAILFVCLYINDRRFQNSPIHDTLNPIWMAETGFLIFLVSNTVTLAVSNVYHRILAHLIGQELVYSDSGTIQGAYAIHSEISETVLNAYIANWFFSHDPNHPPKLFMRSLMALYNAFSLVPLNHFINNHLSSVSCLRVILVKFVVPVYAGLITAYMFGSDLGAAFILSIFGFGPFQGIVPLLMNEQVSLRSSTERV